MTSPIAVAMGDQLHAEITRRGNDGARAICASQDFHPSEDERMLIEIGVQAGLHAAMRTLADKGWLRVEVQS